MKDNELTKRLRSKAAYYESERMLHGNTFAVMREAADEIDTLAWLHAEATYHAIIRGIETIYEREGVAIWLSSPQRALDGRSVWEVLHDGDGWKVMQIVDQLETGAFV